MAVLSGWTETILLSITFVIVIIIGIAGMNGLYGKDNVVPLIGNHTMTVFNSFDSSQADIVGNGTMGNLINYANNSQSNILGGTILTGSVFGINIAQSYKILLGVVDLVWTFISGNWISNVVGMMMLGSSGMWLGTVFQIIWILSILFGLLYIFFKVVV
jgi:hypothetical protein